MPTYWTSDAGLTDWYTAVDPVPISVEAPVASIAPKVVRPPPPIRAPPSIPPPVTPNVAHAAASTTGPACCAPWATASNSGDGGACAVTVVLGFFPSWLSPRQASAHLPPGPSTS